MDKIKIIGCYDSDLKINYEARERNYDRCQERGVEYDNICAFCGRELKADSPKYGIRKIDGGDVATEYKGEDVYAAADCGWWYIGPICYKKYKKAAREIEVDSNK